MNTTRNRAVLAIACLTLLVALPVNAQDAPSEPELTPEVAPPPEPSELADDWARRLGVPREDLDRPANVEALGNKARQDAEVLRAELQNVDVRLKRARGVLEALEAATPEAATARRVNAVRRKMAAARVSGIVAERNKLEGRLVSVLAADTWLEERRETLTREAERRAKEAQEAARLREEARKAEEEASEASQQKLQEIAIAEREVLAAQDAHSRRRVELATRRAAVARETYYIIERRKHLVRALESEGEAATSLAEWKTKVAERLRAVRAEPDAVTTAKETNAADRAAALFDELARHRADARDRIHNLGPPTRAALQFLEAARDGDDGAEVEAANEENVELRRVQRDLAAALRERQREHVKLLELRSNLSARALDRAYSEFRYARRSQAALVSHLPESRRAQIRALNTANVTGVGDEFDDFWLEVQHEYLTERGLLFSIPDKLFSVEGFLWVGKFGLFLLVVFLGIRFVRARKDRFATEATRFVLDHNILRLPPRLVIKLFEVIQAIAVDAAKVAGALFLLHQLPGHLPVFDLIEALIYAIAAYRLGTMSVETLMLPRWYRENTDREKWGAAVQVDIDGDGIDLFDLELERAQFAVATCRALLVYTVACQFTLWLTRATLGNFFLSFWVHVLGYFGYAVVIYALLSLWKDVIARQFARMDSSEKSEAELFVNRHKDRPWGVIVIFVALAWLSGRDLARWTRHRVTGLDVTRRLSNFFLRKRIEREAGAKAVQKQPLTETLPPALLAAFAETPEASEPHLVARTEITAQVDALWTRFTGGRDGSVAVVGEQGVGKSTFLSQVEARLRQGELDVDATALDRKIITEAELTGFVAGTMKLDLESYTVDSVVQTILAGPRRAVVIDDCHHTFLRAVEGFEALEALLEIVSLTNHHVFWVLAFDELGWKYMNRFRSWGARVAVLELRGLDDDEVRQMIEDRVEAAGFGVSYDNLVVSRGGQDRGYQVVESAAGYFRLLTEFSRGNPRIAVRYWLRSLALHEDGLLHVSLFDTTAAVSITDLRSDEGFALAAVVQHDSLDAAELARVLGADIEMCALYLNAWREAGLIRVNPKTGRARALPDQLRQLRRQLAEIHFLYGA